MVVTLHEHGQQARLLLSFQHEDATPEFTWHFAESVFVTFCKFARLMLGEPLGQGEITFQHERPAGSPEWANALGLPMRYGQSVNAIWFDRHVMDRPLRGALPSLHQAAGQRVRLADLFAHQRKADPLAVGQLVGEHLRNRFRLEQRLAARPLTGRTNQIRIHCEFLGFPVLGDAAYGNEDTSPRQTLGVDEPPLCLHAWKLEFSHPVSGEAMSFTFCTPGTGGRRIGWNDQ